MERQAWQEFRTRWRELNFDSLPEEGGDRADPFGQVTQEFAITTHTAQEGAHLLETPRHEHFDQGDNFVPARPHAGGRNGVAQKNSTRGHEAGLRGRELEVVLAQALEERTHGLDVSRRVGVEDDHIVEVSLHLFQALYDLVDNLDEPPG